MTTTDATTNDPESTHAPAKARGRRAQKGGRKAWAPDAGDELAAILRTLMVRPWLTAGRDDEMIAAARRNETAITNVFTRLGWVVIIERDMVRLRKSPPPRRTTYAADGPKHTTCTWFFLLVAAAESLPPKVSIAQLVTSARAAASEAHLPVTNDMPERRAITAALRLLDDRGVIERMDGELDAFLTDENAPVLLAVHHTRLLHVIANFAPLDPVTDTAAWLDLVEREPDPARRMRRRLVQDTLIHTEDLDDNEADWLSRRVRGDDGAPLADAFGLHLERRAEGAAFVVPDEAFRHHRELGPRIFPGPGTVAHAALLLTDHAATHGQPTTGRPGWRTLPGNEVRTSLATWGHNISAGRGGWAAEDIADPTALAAKVADLLIALDLVRLEPPQAPPTDALWSFSPVNGRWAAGAADRARATAPTTDVPREPAHRGTQLDLAMPPSALTVFITEPTP